MIRRNSPYLVLVLLLRIFRARDELRPPRIALISSVLYFCPQIRGFDKRYKFYSALSSLYTAKNIFGEILRCFSNGLESF